MPQLPAGYEELAALVDYSQAHGYKDTSASQVRRVDGSIAWMETLAAQINLTNSRTLIDGESMTCCLARRDARRQQLQLLRSFLDTASSLSDRARMSEIKIVSTVNVAALQKDLDQKSKALRELDGKIQAANWSTDLEEN